MDLRLWALRPLLRSSCTKSSGRSSGRLLLEQDPGQEAFAGHLQVEFALHQRWTTAVHCKIKGVAAKLFLRKWLGFATYDTRHSWSFQKNMIDDYDLMFVKRKYIKHFKKHSL